jgi:SAM-dependent methyltransferase
MSVFQDYSKYYDLLYQDKPYQQEVDYVSDLILEFKPDVKNILELGCGTGRHANLLNKKGFNIHGIDLSKTMLEQAKIFQNNQVSFELGDVRNYRIEKKFDSVISLFHVASYQTSNEDLLKFFVTANYHLNKGGLFIFDVWYGPAVLSEKPEERVKNLEDNNLKITRKASPRIDFNKNIVDVNYDIEIFDKKNNAKHHIQEIHKMRYLFKPELEIIFGICGFQLIKCEEWLSKKDSNKDTWGVCFVVSKIDKVYSNKI